MFSIIAIVSACILGAIFLICFVTSNNTKKKEEDEEKGSGLDLHFVCKNGCSFEPIKTRDGYIAKPCWKMWEEIWEIDGLVTKYQLDGIKEIEPFLQGNINAYAKNCRQKAELYELIKSEKYNNNESIKIKIKKLDKQNEAIAKKFIVLRKQVEELARAAKTPANLDGVIVEGNEEMHHLDICSAAIRKAVAEIKAQEGEKQ